MDALSSILGLPERDKEAGGLLFTPQEIFQQPRTWRKSYERFLELRSTVEGFLKTAGVGAAGEKQPTILLVGAGTSDYIGRALVHLLKQKWRCEVMAVPSTDLLTNMDDLVFPGRPYLWISFSRSGDSSEGVAVLESAFARYPEIRHLIVTCNRDGLMAREFKGRENVLCLVLDDAVNDRGLAMTSSFSNMLIIGQCLAHTNDIEKYEIILNELISAGEKFLSPAAGLASTIAAEKFSKIYFLGTGPLNAVAVESGLKVMELTAGRVITMAESYLGVRHGPLSAVDEGTLIAAYISADKRRRAYELDLIREVSEKRLAGKIATIVAGEYEQGQRELVNYSINYPCGGNVTDKYRPPVDVIFGQLLGLFSSLQQGLKPDAPSPQGAISRVVSLVRLH